ncbi:hypothetical protein [Thalassolituus oleivorans]|jgi:hypothetical protein|uniref:Uncharacterized protein n=1 Tax=Thalassolituus oleivorans MIL-1 TaxID=1298593 RepID=M5EA19_9GAMM|nr:hypothetical protein [Thalassolituus oleivorans]MCA6126965.1 hypothetical protein [Thalassolituus oleivorans 4BN06-13]CCU74101.1 hypothetical protein TOL_3718 [Thalassolituus oleivorans MIL-1]
MSGEQQIVNSLLQQMDDAVVAEVKTNAAYVEDLLFTELLARMQLRRSSTDILHQVNYQLTFAQKNLDDDEFVVTRGC